ncbi:MAG: alkaline phosphatase D family protein [Thalassotalea sp.]
MKRRRFIQLSTASLATAMLPSMAAKLAARRENLTSVLPIEMLANNTSRHWLGKSFWGNRLQDWRLHKGKIECLRAEKDFEMRTVSLLTRSLNSQHLPARLSATIQSLTPNKKGFCGFLFGVGKGELDYRGAALAQRAGGENGGFMAVIDDSGELSFRDFSDAKKSLAFEKIDRSGTASISLLANKAIHLDCHIDPINNGNFDVRLIAIDSETGQELGFIVRTNVPAAELQGGVMLLSSPDKQGDGARYSFDDIKSGGGKLDINSAHELGPVMGCLHSLNQNVLKLSAQFMPIALTDNAKARLEYKKTTEKSWQYGQTSKIETGFVALFRISDWDPKNTYDYRIVFPEQKHETLFYGQIVKDPGNSKELKIALYSCIIPTAKSLDQPVYKPLIPQERTLKRYTTENILFPHNQLVNNCDSHQPDLYVFCGDQYYETYPTRYGSHTPEAKLDTLYRWYLWYWAFRDSVRNKPCIILADDHDVLQGNLWGHGGKDSGTAKEQDGGYKWDKDLVKMVYRIEHGHNPDAYDPTPIEHGIPVTYGKFVYGGISFAVIEDRKFKTPPKHGVDPKHTRGELLGKRQEDFLAAWADMDKGLPKICITASIWGSPQTKANFKPALDYDANGYPPDGRTRAVQLVKNANALILAGDQHLGMVSKQGINDFDDGPLFFAGPAAAAFWQRWFEGNNQLPNQLNNDPNTGNFTDTFGNKMRVLAVSNPKLSHQEFNESNTSWGKFIADNQLKSEGYGLIRVNHQNQHYILESWPWDADPSKDQQFKGWPYVHAFEEKIHDNSPFSTLSTAL